MLALGEVHTGLLQNSTSVSQAKSAELLALVPGERVRQSSRPIGYVVSPDRLTGVDCHLATASKARVRAVGTVVSHATITGGHVLQGSTCAEVVTGEADRRMPWSHYMSRPGVVETLGKAAREDLVSGFTGTKPASTNLDLGAVSDRLMDEVQLATSLDRRPPFRTARTRLRWVARTAPERPGQIWLSIEDDTLRAAAIASDVEDPLSIAAFCEDLALHDWLLTTLIQFIERSRIGDGPTAHVIDRLRPAMDHLLHLWMPAARLDQAVLPLWDSLERRPGFTRQWQALVDRIRDQVSAGITAVLGDVVPESGRRA